LVLCHGLFGFDTFSRSHISISDLDIGGYDAFALPPLATVHYWRGIKEALEQAGCARVIITRVPKTASIEERAAALRNQIAKKCHPGETINLLGHSMVFIF
jgi:triacylglycerol esterase/lipase EstA (alpha/beta hydrolase family)